MHFQLVLKLRPRQDALLHTGEMLGAFAARAEALPGCMSAEVYADGRHSDRLVFVEEWASEEALKAHLQSESHRKLHGIAAGSNGQADAQIHRISQTSDAVVVGGT